MPGLRHHAQDQTGNLYRPNGPAVRSSLAASTQSRHLGFGNWMMIHTLWLPEILWHAEYAENIKYMYREGGMVASQALFDCR